MRTMLADSVARQWSFIEHHAPPLCPLSQSLVLLPCCQRIVCAATATFATATAAVKERGELRLRLSYILRAGRARVVGQAGRAVPFVA